ncbi:MAG: hypothetical protein J7527_04350 [Chitinophagaceae bacterium]|nr:hypothetical protein [Chitinophagaceae bacterium]
MKIITIERYSSDPTKPVDQHGQINLHIHRAVASLPDLGLELLYPSILRSSSIHRPFIFHYFMEDEWKNNGG